MTSFSIPTLPSDPRALPQRVDESLAVDPPPNYSGQEIPVVLDIDEAQLAAMDPECRACIEGIIALAETRLGEWQSLEITFPESRFSDGAAVIQLRDLFQAPDNSELTRLALDEEGKFTALTSEQRAQARKTGTFVIPSEDFPGQDHVWRLSRILQKGSDHIQETNEGYQASIFDQILVQIPQRLSRDGKVSLGHGLRNIYQGLRAIPAFTLGLKEERGRYSRWTIEELIEAEKLTIIRALLVEYQKGDDRLYREELTQHLAGTLRQMKQDWSAFQNANREAWEQAHLSSLAATDSSGSGLSQKLSEALDAMISTQYCSFIEGYPALEEKEPGYGVLLANAYRAELIAERFQTDFMEITGRQDQVIEERLQAEHRIKSRSDQWLSSHVAKEFKEFSRNGLWLELEEIPPKLEGVGLKLEAQVYRAVLEFHKERESVYRAALEAEKVASRTFRFSTRIWASKNWGTYEYEGRDGRVYKAVKDSSSEVRTNQPFWRLRIIKKESTAVWKNSLHGLLVSNLWNGSVGIKSLLKKNAFIPEKTMDAKTGEIVADESSRTHTLRSRLHALWDSSAESRRKFEERPDTGILPKNFSRSLNRFYNNGIKGIGGSALLITGQPLLTAVNVVGTGILSLTSPLWAPAKSVLQYGLDPILYDANSPQDSDNQKVRTYFPIIGHTVSDLAIAGAGQTVVALASAAVIHPATAGVTGIYAGLRKWTRTAYDFTMAHTILRGGRQPASDTWLNTRIHGPGLSQDYFFQVRPEIAVLALQAELEKVELQFFRDDVSGVITEPSKRLNDFFASLMANIGRMDISKNPTAQRLGKVEAARLKEFKKDFCEREELLSNVSNLREEKSRIRQVASDLNDTIAISEQLVASFYLAKLQPYMNENQTLAFWNKAKLSVGDYKRLARQYLAEIFSPDFLEPLEVTDEHFVIDVSDPSAREFLKTLIKPRD